MPSPRRAWRYATGLSIETVALYQPLLFPLALQLGGFFFLAYGLSPWREKRVKVGDRAAVPAPKRAAVKAQKAPRTKKVKALPKPVPLLPAGIVSFDDRAAMRAEK